MAPSSSAKCWLPGGAVLPERIKPHLERAVAQWSAHWFVEAQAAISPAFQDDWPDAGSGVLWRSVPSSACLCLTATGQAGLAAAMLGASVPHGPLPESDRSVVSKLASSCAEDLVSRVHMLAVPGAARPPVGRDPLDAGGWSWWEISFGAGRRLLKLAVDPMAMVGLVRQSLPQGPKMEIKPVRKALGAQPVGIAAALGSCAISLADLKQLSVGDVLVLDRPADGPVGLLVNQSPSSLRAVLEAADGTVSAKIVPESHANA